MTDTYVITTSGDNAGEDLKEELNDLDYDIEDVVESKVTLTIEESDGDLSEQLEEMPDSNDRDPAKANMSVPCVDPSTKLFDFLKVLHRKGPLTNQELVENSDYGSASGTANELWHRGLIDREKTVRGAYRNRLSEKGERELRHHTQ